MGGSSTDCSAACVSQRRQAPVSDVKEGGEDVPPLLLAMDASESDISCESAITHNAHRRYVSFASVVIREYSVTIGDHPCCTMGCPLSLDWDYLPESNTSLDVYEAQRSPRRSRQQLRTTAVERSRILAQEGGFSDGELRSAQRKLHRARSCSARLNEKMSESFFRHDDKLRTKESDEPVSSCA